MVLEYKTIDGMYESKIEEKKSQFFSYIKYVETEEDAKNFISDIIKKNNNARHNVPVYRILTNKGIVEKYSDDGEPSKTAGLPILDVLRGNELVNIVVVVTRYFGGVLLGTGGLVRAYSGAIKATLNKAKIINKEYCSIYQLIVDYDKIGIIKNFCSKKSLLIKNIDYMENVIFSIIVKVSKEKEFLSNITNVFNGKEKIKKIKNTYIKLEG